jgi:hypothetical protein
MVENHTLIDSRISFKAITSSLEVDLQHNMLVSSANKIGFDTLFIEYGKSLMYIKKSNGPRIEPRGTPYLTFCHSETPLEILLFSIVLSCLSVK